MYRWRNFPPHTGDFILFTLPLTDLSFIVLISYRWGHCLTQLLFFSDLCLPMSSVLTTVTHVVS